MYAHCVCVWGGGGEEKVWRKEKVKTREKEGMHPEIDLQLLLCRLLSSPADGRYEQDEEHHRTGTIQSLQGQGQEFIVAMTFIVAMICAHLERSNNLDCYIP